MSAVETVNVIQGGYKHRKSLVSGIIRRAEVMAEDDQNKSKTKIPVDRENLLDYYGSAEKQNAHFPLQSTCLPRSCQFMAS